MSSFVLVMDRSSVPVAPIFFGAVLFAFEGKRVLTWLHRELRSMAFLDDVRSGDSRTVYNARHVVDHDMQKGRQ